ncbi:MAG TPA: lysylphosphatidylglycerol synthase domain-containing protein [Chitinophagaceae bacterium]|nr:lysylphosphatidylglycerol synthase domain-containing protein [Chitinophagaceae bacterium]
MFKTNKNIKIFFNYVLGPLLGVWLFYSLYQQVKAQPHLQESLELIKQAPFGEQAWKFWLVIILAFVNWGLEAKKWQILMKTLQPLNYFIAFKGVLAGITLSLNTPNRIGEYGGRVLYVNDGNKIKSVPLSIAGSICQLTITVLMGCGGLVFLLITQSENGMPIMGLSLFWIKVLLSLSIFGTILLLLFLFRLSWIINIFEKVPRFLKYVQYISALDEFTPKLLLRLLILSLLRYLVFVIQYIFLLQVLQVEINWQQGFWLLTILYLVMTIVPSFAIADLGIRGKFSTALLSLYSANTIGILGTTFGIWFINLFIPALAGSYFIIRKKFFKERE